MAGTHHRSHIMENVTLTPKEQSRLQVLNSLAAEHMTLDQAAELMGVTSRVFAQIMVRGLIICSSLLAKPKTPGYRMIHTAFGWACWRLAPDVA